MISSLQQKATGLLATHRVPGVALASIRGGRIDKIVCAGTSNSETRQPVSEQTRFQAASLSKPVFAYVVLQLADAGRFPLDQPLARYLPDYQSSDPAAGLITARHILSHTSGLPNWRNDRYPLKAHFAPGSRFSYSGEGFVYLQKAVEAAIGETTEALTQRLVFAPLGMTRSSFVRPEDFASDDARPYTVASTLHDRHPGSDANAAHSLITTAPDFARFLLVALSGAGLTDETAQQWLLPVIRVPAWRIDNLDDEPAACDPAVGWGLGWGIETLTGHFFHWGANPGYKNFVLCSRQDGTAVVILTNGDAGFSLIPALLADLIPGPRPGLVWLGYQ